MIARPRRKILQALAGEPGLRELGALAEAARLGADQEV